MSNITPSLLLDHLRCVHKVWRDVYGPKEEFVDEDNPFLKLLWDRGIQHEADIVANFGFEYVDCSRGTEAERIYKTNAAIAAHVGYIYQGVLAHGNLFGIPDLLQFIDGEYVPVEIKSGSASEGGDDDGREGKPKREYGVQLALYVDILNKKGLNSSRRAFIIDKTGERTEYDLNSPMGPQSPSMWQLYVQIKAEVEASLRDELHNKPALVGACKNCGWYASCTKWAKENDDLTQLFDVGRVARDSFDRHFSPAGIDDIIRLDPHELLAQKRDDNHFLRRVGHGTIRKIFARGPLMKSGGDPIMYERFAFPEVSTELFFDIETDPTQDFVYLHGFWVRDRKGQRFVHFTATEISDEQEREYWKRSIDFITSFDAADVAIYYYSSYERTIYRQLRKKYPDVIGETDLDELFARPTTIDLYTDLILKGTDWPLGSYGIKAIAQYLGFVWRDETPSGALSIQWFNDYLTTRDEEKLKRVLEYNEDDCKATMVVKDYLKQRMSEGELLWQTQTTRLS